MDRTSASVLRKEKKKLKYHVTELYQDATTYNRRAPDDVMADCYQKGKRCEGRRDMRGLISLPSIESRALECRLGGASSLQAR